MKRRLENAKKLRRKFSKGRHKLILFSDESRFQIGQGHNPQNDRSLSRFLPPLESRISSRTMNLPGVMVWGGLGYEVKTSLIFFGSRSRMNSRKYREFVLEPLKTWAEETYEKMDHGRMIGFFSRTVQLVRPRKVTFNG